MRRSIRQLKCKQEQAEVQTVGAPLAASFPERTLTRTPAPKPLTCTEAVGAQTAARTTGTTRPIESR